MATVVGVATLAATAPLGAQPGPDDDTVTLASELRWLSDLSLLPRYRTGSTLAQVSSYDTTGGNDDGFRGTYSSIRREGGARVLLDVEGPGVIERIWTPTPTDRMLAFYFDGEATPRLRLPFSELFSGDHPPFVHPLVGNEVGGYFDYLPLPYARSLKIVYEGEDIRFHQIEHRTLPPGTGVETFPREVGEATREALARVAELWGAAGRDLPVPPGAQVSELPFDVAPGTSAEVFRREGGGRIVGLEIEAPQGAPVRSPGVILEARWDGEAVPAVLAPANDFFGYAFGRPAAAGLLLGSVGGRDYSYLPMPFDRSATLTLRVLATESAHATGTVRVTTSDAPRDPATEGRLYALWRRQHDPEEGTPYLLLEAEGRGHQVGTLLQAQGLAAGMTEFFEGDDRTDVDGALRLHGTGSEDYFNGGWYALLDRWDRGMSLPLHGALDYSLPLSRTGGYRFYLSDKVSFERSIRQTIEHGPEGNRVPVDYTSVAFWYGDTPPPSVMDPAAGPPPARPPGTHVFYPQLLQLSLGFGTSARFTGGALVVDSDASREGLVRIDLSDLEPGRYRLRLSYRQGPDAGAFSVWRRQTPISDWIDAGADTEQRVEEADMGEIEITAQARSVTVRTRAVEGRTTFRLDRLILEEMR